MNYLLFAIWEVAQASQAKFFRFLVIRNLHCPQPVQVFDQTIVLGFPTDINKMLTQERIFSCNSERINFTFQTKYIHRNLIIFSNLFKSLSLTGISMPSRLRFSDCSARSFLILWGCIVTGLRALVTLHLKHWLY